MAKSKSPYNEESGLFRSLTRLFSGPIVQRRTQTGRQLRRRHLDIYSKRFKSATGKQFKKYFGPSSFFGKSFGKLNQKLISPFLGGLGAALKGGAFVLGLLALIEFLNSDLWKNLRNTLIPDIKEKLDAGLKSLKRISESFFGKNEYKRKHYYWNYCF